VGTLRRRQRETRTRSPTVAETGSKNRSTVDVDPGTRIFVDAHPFVLTPASANLLRGKTRFRGGGYVKEARTILKLYEEFGYKYFEILAIKPRVVRNGSPKSFSFSPRRLFPLPPIPATTMSNIANEKGSINYSGNIGDEHHHGSGGNAASALPAHTYVHNTAPQLRVIGNPGPL